MRVYNRCLLHVIAGAGLQPVSTIHYGFGATPTEIKLIGNFYQRNTSNSKVQEGKRKKGNAPFLRQPHPCKS